MYIYSPVGLAGLDVAIPSDSSDPCDYTSLNYDPAVCSDAGGVVYNGPTATVPTSPTQPGYTLPVEVFEKTLPIILQAGGVQPIPSAIPTSLPGIPPFVGPIQQKSSILPAVVLGLLVLFLFSGGR